MRLRWIVLTALIMCCTIPAGALDIKDKTFTTENAGKVVFSHAIHLKKKNPKSPNISCKACHNEAMKKNVHYTMAQMEQGKSCGQCHNGKRAFALAKCAACHKVRDIAFKVKETGPVLFKHSLHLRSNSSRSAWLGTWAVFSIALFFAVWIGTTLITSIGASETPPLVFLKMTALITTGLTLLGQILVIPWLIVVSKMISGLLISCASISSNPILEQGKTGL